jgi:hypothetical protein
MFEVQPAQMPTMRRTIGIMLGQIIFIITSSPDGFWSYSVAMARTVVGDCEPPAGSSDTAITCALAGT